MNERWKRGFAVLAAAAMWTCRRDGQGVDAACGGGRFLVRRAIVEDTRSGLRWMRRTHPSPMPFAAADAACHAAGMRLPSVFEFRRLLSPGGALDACAFPSMPDGGQNADGEPLGSWTGNLDRDGLINDIRRSAQAQGISTGYATRVVVVPGGPNPALRDQSVDDLAWVRCVVRP